MRADMTAAAGDARSVLVHHPSLEGGTWSRARFYRELAERYVGAGQPTRALVALDAAIEARPDDAAAHARAAKLLLDQGRVAEALGRLQLAVRMDPDRVEAWDLLGGLAIDRRDYTLAEKAQRAILRREPTNVDAWLRLGAVLARQEKWSEAA
jgi:tetratricopeptide (TPR) repeat protein